MKTTLILLATALSLGATALAAESLPPITDGKVPQKVEELWAGYDPSAEPLDVKVIREWDEVVNGKKVKLQMLTFKVGTFKGKDSRIAAYFAWPVEVKEKVPGLLQIHGGGQRANKVLVLADAANGYASISINWLGHKLDDQQPEDAGTDWGALDPTQKNVSHYSSTKPAPFTLDAVPSPRNNSWFILTLTARRALTFLEQQPMVDGSRLGVYGHSMGGKISVLTAGSDDRVKAVAPSCGGISDRQNTSPLYVATIADNNYLKNISCPIFFLSPSNDFHGLINHLPVALHELKTPEWRLTISPHHNHQDTAEYEVATQVWMDRYLKGEGVVPETPWTQLNLKTSDGVPEISIRPDTAKPVLGVEVYYTREGQMVGAKDDFINTKNRFWYYAPAQKVDGVWKAKLPLCGLEKPLWVYANVIYGLDKPIQGAGYYARAYSADRFVISSPPQIFSNKQLQDAGVKATRQPSLLIENFEGDWKKQWFAYKPEEWAISTHKIYTEEWKAPSGSHLAFEVRSAQPNKLAIGLSDAGAEVALQGGQVWQTVVLDPAHFLNAANEPLKDWTTIKELRLGAQETLRGKSTKELGGKWQGPPPEFRNLRWIVGS